MFEIHRTTVRKYENPTEHIAILFVLLEPANVFEIQIENRFDDRVETNAHINSPIKEWDEACDRYVAVVDAWGYPTLGLRKKVERLK